jgi:hypothetical protein
MIYDAFGLTIRSQIQLPELLTNNLPNVAETDVDIHFGRVSEDDLEDGTQVAAHLWISQSKLCFQVPDVARFLVCEGQKITIDPVPGIDEETIRLYLLGSAFGVLLMQRGYLVLHGNAIRVGGKCMVCVGDSGAGKSTLAAGFMQRGYNILADDVVPVDQHCSALPGFPRIKLWQDAADRLGIDTKNLQRIRPDMEKFSYPLFNQFARQTLPIRWIYILDSHNATETVVEPIVGLQRFRPLLDNTYTGGVLEGMGMKAEHLQSCCKLAGQIRLARITRPEQGFELDSLIDRILSDIAENP